LSAQRVFDHNNIQSGFDVEVLFGGGYLKEVLIAASRAEIIPSKVFIPDTPVPMYFVLMYASRCEVLDRVEVGDPDLRITFPIGFYSEPSEREHIFIDEGLIEVDLQAEFSGQKLYTSSPQARAIELGNIKMQCEIMGRDLDEELNKTVRDYFDGKVWDFEMFSGGVRRVEFKKLQSVPDVGAPAGYAAYVNLDMNMRNVAIDAEHIPQDIVGSQILVVNENGFKVDENGRTRDKHEHRTDDEGRVPDECCQLHVLDAEGTIIDPSAVIAAGENSIIYHAVGNAVVGSVAVNETGSLSIRDKSNRPISAVTVYKQSLENPPRGIVSLGQNYLRSDTDFVIGVGKSVLKRFEQAHWNNLGDPTRGGTTKRRVLDNFGDTIGHYLDFDLGWREGGIYTRTRCDYHITAWPDADVKVRAMITPSVFAGDLKVDVNVTDIDADTGPLGDLLGALIGGALGLFGFFAGPIAGGMFVGAGLAFGAAISEVAEDEFGNAQKDDIEKSIQSQMNQGRDGGTALAMFGLIPSVLGFFEAPRTDKFHRTFPGTRHLFEHSQVDLNGMTLAGSATGGTAFIPLMPVTIIGRRRKEREDGSAELVELTYRNQYGESEAMSLVEVERRFLENRIGSVFLTVAATRKSKYGREYLFTSGVALLAEEVAMLMEKKLLTWKGVNIVRSRQHGTYLRTPADKSFDNNLVSLPRFKLDSLQQG